MPTMDFNDYLVDRGLDQDQGIAATFANYLRTLPLAALRESVGVTQADMGRRLKKSQAAVSKFEGRSDFLLSTFVHYVQELGGTVEVKATVGGEEFEVSPEWSDGEMYFALTKKAFHGMECLRVHDLARKRKAVEAASRETAVTADRPDVWWKTGFNKLSGDFLSKLAANDELQPLAA